jgi:hypothetical protein
MLVADDKMFAQYRSGGDVRRFFEKLKKVGESRPGIPEFAT